MKTRWFTTALLALCVAWTATTFGQQAQQEPTLRVLVTVGNHDFEEAPFWEMMGFTARRRVDQARSSPCAHRMRKRNLVVVSTSAGGEHTQAGFAGRLRRRSQI